MNNLVPLVIVLALTTPISHVLACMALVSAAWGWTHAVISR